MAKQDQTLTRHDLEAKIVKRCLEDEGFRKEFTTDPAAAFVKYLEIPAASLPKISVHQEEPGSWHIVLPPRPTNVDELSEQELETVAGGTTPVIEVGVSALASAYVSAFASVTIAGSVLVANDTPW
jgi:hypothetical protein